MEKQKARNKRAFFNGKLGGALFRVLTVPHLYRAYLLMVLNR